MGDFGRHGSRALFLAVYFARSLGAVVCAPSGAAFYVAGRPALQGAYIRLTIAIYVLVGGAHVWGAVEGSQPMTETLEIGMWALLIALALAFLPRGEREDSSDSSFQKRSGRDSTNTHL